MYLIDFFLCPSETFLINVIFPPPMIKKNNCWCAPGLCAVHSADLLDLRHLGGQDGWVIIRELL